MAVETFARGCYRLCVAPKGDSPGWNPGRLLTRTCEVNMNKEHPTTAQPVGEERTATPPPPPTAITPPPPPPPWWRQALTAASVAGVASAVGAAVKVLVEHVLRWR